MNLPPDTPEQSELIDGPDAFRQALLHCASETRRTFSLYSPDLAREVYDLPELAEALSEIARRHRQAQVQLLVRDTRALVEYGHGLVRLAQRLPSKVTLRRLTNDIETQAIAFALGDREHLVYQNDPDNYHGFYDRQAGARVKTLREIFDRAWETAEEDPRLRQLAL
ncbi:MULTISPECIES: hypothetical protein [unclassified Marinimicrobium]|jgi:hypothetical protein|uniref:DUF7931 domain-containing protein n=1 Tax=unclassified Marinimicrobium TaxID=2632100 RepID=UPI000C5AA82D|nr:MULTISPECIES: hypothetical protein [unclassified Marinimicrobium]MAN51702.1 hypothetical protein [Marinimicrobium sp.]